MKVLNSVLSIFKPKPKEIPGGHKECPVCEGTGDYDSFIDCVACDGEGHMEINQYYKKLHNGDFIREY